jgi:hypothetical protein
MGTGGNSHTPVSPGRPRAVLDEGLLRELQALGWGYKRVAAEYRSRTGEYVSHMTVRDRLCRTSRVTKP